LDGQEHGGGTVFKMIAIRMRATLVSFDGGDGPGALRFYRNGWT
jgi:hypothetical protein